ncbi:Gamma-tubulin complex component 4 [Kappamyces sp. JEL0829]|nr:Gamma-tubulin complex component 4 [Kappamyces sp. JEL0829]
MLHELVVALLGHSGDVFEEPSFEVSLGFPNLHPSERLIMNHTAQLGKLYSEIRHYTQSPGSEGFEFALKNSIEEWLEQYRVAVVELEEDVMFRPVFVELVSFVKKLSQPDLEDRKGIRLLNAVHQKFVESGNHRVRAMFQAFLDSLLGFFAKQLVLWLFYARINDPDSEFMIVDKAGCLAAYLQGSLLAHWDRFDLVELQRPYFMTAEHARNVLFIGKASAVLKTIKLEKGADTAQSTPAHDFAKSAALGLVDSLRNRSDYECRETLEFLSSVRQEIGVLLFEAVTANHQIAYHFQAFRAIYLCGMGNFIDLLIDEELKLSQRLQLSLVPVNCNDIHQLFKRAYKNTANGEVWASYCKPNFHWEEFGTDVDKTNNNSYLVFGVDSYLNYRLSWPMNLLISASNIDSYNNLFFFFSLLKKTSKRLVSLNRIVQGQSWNSVPSAARLLCSRQIFFLNSLWSYIQMDLVDSQFEELVGLADPKNPRKISLDELQETHSRILKTLTAGCFLDHSVASKKISSSIHEVLLLVSRTCNLAEKASDPLYRDTVSPQSFLALARDLDTQFKFLFEVFQGIQDSSRSLVGQFLVRFDFNKWFSQAEPDR